MLSALDPRKDTPPAEPYYEDRSRQHFGTSPNGVPFSFMWESSADSARRAQAGRRAGRPFGADGFDPFELFNMMFGKGIRIGGWRSHGRRAWTVSRSFRNDESRSWDGWKHLGDDDPFMQNHRRMADTMGFGFGSPFGPPRGHPGGHSGHPAHMQATGPFSHGHTTSTSTSTTYGGFSRREPEHNNTHCQRPHRDRHAHSRRQRERHRPHFRTGGKLGSHQRSATAKPSSTTERRASSSFRTTSYRTNSAQSRRSRDRRQSNRSRYRMMMTGVSIIDILRHSN
ncbi:hypothetical protein L1887_59912 [Cichorium endivia]|nr:hypothetical protein L1887_59912 [Cichorium endivia]